MHKSGGSLTQSSLLMIGAGRERGPRAPDHQPDADHERLVPADEQPRHLAQEPQHTRGREIFAQGAASLAQYAREEVGDIGDYYAYSREIVNGDSIYDFDPTKLSVHTLDIGLAGVEVYDILRDEYDIQVEFGDVANILAYISVGDRERDIERLVSALAEIRRLYKRDKAGMMQYGVHQPRSGCGDAAGGVLRRDGIAAHRSKRGAYLRGERDVLSAGHTDPCPG